MEEVMAESSPYNHFKKQAHTHLLHILDIWNLGSHENNNVANSNSKQPQESF